MTGKEKCKLLKAIRREIAETNGIVYLTSECTFEGECKGTCPKCDAEIRYLDGEINRLIRNGKKISLAGLSLKMYDDVVKTAKLTSDGDGDCVFVTDSSKMGSLDFMPQDDSMLETEGFIRPLKNVSTLLDMPISEIDFGTHTYMFLECHGIKTVRELTIKLDDKMKRALGKKSLKEIEEKLADLGIQLKNDPWDEW